MSDRARSGARRLSDTPWFRGLARSGFAASGVVQILVGVLAIQVAVQGGGQEADQTGALESLSRAPGGAFVVWAIAVGGLALALQLLIDAALTRRGDAKATWGHRLSDLGKAVVYGAVGVAALRVALGAGGGSGRSSSRRGSAAVLDLPGGQVLLAVAGLVVVGVGVALVVRGITKRFVRSIHVPPGDRGRLVVALGRVGYVARGVAVVVVGVLFVVAAVRTDPGAASGLDGALRTFAGLPFGRVVLAVVGAGWIASGVYSVLRARLAKLD